MAGGLPGRDVQDRALRAGPYVHLNLFQRPARPAREAPSRTRRAPAARKQKQTLFPGNAARLRHWPRTPGETPRQPSDSRPFGLGLPFLSAPRPGPFTPDPAREAGAVRSRQGGTLLNALDRGETAGGEAAPFSHSQTLGPESGDRLPDTSRPVRSRRGRRRSVPGGRSRPDSWTRGVQC